MVKSASRENPLDRRSSGKSAKSAHSRKREPRPNQNETSRMRASRIYGERYEQTRIRKSLIDEYGDAYQKEKSVPVDGKKLSEDLRRLHRLTGDPIFLVSRTVLHSYGLDQNAPRRSAKSFRGMKLDEELAIYKMRRAIERARRSGKKLSVRAVVEKCASDLRSHASFDTSVQRLLRLYAVAKSKQFKIGPLLEGDTFAKIHVAPVGGLYGPGPTPLPPEGAVFNDTKRWRVMFYGGRVSVRFIGKKNPSNKYTDPAG